MVRRWDDDGIIAPGGQARPESDDAGSCDKRQVAAMVGVLSIARGFHSIIYFPYYNFFHIKYCINYHRK